MTLFDVAIVRKPTKAEQENGKLETLLWGPQSVVAANDRSAAIIAAKMSGDLSVEMERLEVLVRPFD